jgi:hypothetical protein
MSLGEVAAIIEPTERTEHCEPMNGALPRIGLSAIPSAAGDSVATLLAVTDTQVMQGAALTFFNAGATRFASDVNNKFKVVQSS